MTYILHLTPLVLSGAGSVSAIAGEARRLGCRKFLVVTDQGVTRAGILGTVTEQLDRDCVDYAVFDGVEPDPRLACVARCAEAARTAAADGVIGLGGGSSLDVAKATAVLLTNGGSMADYLGPDRVPRPGLPKIMVPTTAGTGSEVSAAVVFTDEADQIKKAAYSRYFVPEVAILDPCLTVSMPPQVTVDTGLDALVHAIEGATSARSNPFSEATGFTAIRMISGALREAASRGDDLRAREQMLLASTLAGMSFTSGGLGGVHALAYSLASEYHLTHGRSNAVLLPHVMRFNLVAAFEKYARVAEAMGEDVRALPVRQAALRAVDAVTCLLEDLGVSYRLRDYAVARDRLEYLADKAYRFGGRLLPNNPRTMSLQDAVRTFQEAW
ncbi:MAG: iron-containing alcohol dehydrogenase [Bacillota bacterium]